MQPLPRPNVLLNPSSATLAIRVLEPREEDVTVEIPMPDEAFMGNYSLEVIGWRSALLCGFHAAFGTSFRIVGAEASPDLTLILLEATPSLVLTSLGERTTFLGEVRYR